MGFVIKVGDLKSDVRDLPVNRWYQAEVVGAEPDINANGNAFTQVTYELFSPEHGSVTFKDRMYEAFPPKGAAFLAAISNMTVEEVKSKANDNNEIEVEPSDFVGARLLVYLQQGKDYRTGEPTEWPSIERPWFAPEGKTELLEG